MRSPRTQPANELNVGRAGSMRRSLSPRANSTVRSVTRSPPFERDINRNGHRSRSRSRSLSRSRSRSRPSRDISYSRSPSPSSRVPRSAKIIVEKLTKNVTEPHLREIFGGFGDIQSLELPMNRAFMTNRGTAYILYHDPADAEAAIAHMHEAQLDGAVLSVSVVLPRKAFSRSPPSQTGRRGSGRQRHGRSPSPHRHRTPPKRYGRSRPAERHDIYRPRSWSRSRSPRRSRTPLSASSSPRTRSRTKSPQRRRRRSPSYSSYGYSSPSGRSRSSSRSRGHSRYAPSRR